MKLQLPVRLSRAEFIPMDERNKILYFIVVMPHDLFQIGATISQNHQNARLSVLIYYFQLAKELINTAGLLTTENTELVNIRDNYWVLNDVRLFSNERISECYFT